jgi:hypothetical protein
MEPRRDLGPSREPVEWLWDPRAFYKLWFDAMSQAMDAYLRSAAFLRLMQHGFRSMSAPGSTKDEAESGSTTPTSSQPQAPV